jgi:hypothetical protein
MTRRIIVAFLLLFASTAFAQRPENRIYMAGGFNYQIASAAPLDYVIDRYNETRNYLTDEMDKVNHMSGAAFSFGFGMGEDVDFLLFEMGLTLGGSGTLTSEGVVNGVRQSRDLKVTSFYINTGFAYLIQTEQKFEYGIGLFVDYGGFRVRTRTYNTGQAVPDFKDIGESNTLVGLTPTIFLDYNFSETFGLSLRPYYRAQIYDNDMSYVSKEINPNTYQNDDYESSHGAMLNGFGGELKAIFFF